MSTLVIVYWIDHRHPKPTTWALVKSNTSCRLKMRLFQKKKRKCAAFLFDLKLFTYEHYKLLRSQYFHLHWFLRSACVVILGCPWIDLWGNWSWRRDIVLNCESDVSKRNTGFPASWRLFPWKTGRLNTFSDKLWSLHKASQFVC